MRRALASLAGIMALSPIVLVLSMVQTVPQSALTVPRVHIASEGAPMRLDPETLGARRTQDGFEIRDDRLDKAIAQIAQRFNVPPRPAKYVMTDQGVAIDRGAPGYQVDMPAARAVLTSALRGGPTDIVLPMAEIAAPQPPRFAVVVRLSEFRLDLYEGGAYRKGFRVGVGALHFPTPPGAYFVKSKAKNPTWRNPGSPWARGMPSYIAAGPRNPLGTRALRLDRGALVIHGTPKPASVGHRSSHGCMRMYRADVEELFEIVPTETPVFIIP